jgi:hypothetical protein
MLGVFRADFLGLSFGGVTDFYSFGGVNLAYREGVTIFCGVRVLGGVLTPIYCLAFSVEKVFVKFAVAGDEATASTCCT